MRICDPRWSKTFRAIDPQDNKQHSDFIDHEHNNCDQHKYLQNFHDAGQQRQQPQKALFIPWNFRFLASLTWFLTSLYQIQSRSSIFATDFGSIIDGDQYPHSGSLSIASRKSPHFACFASTLSMHGNLCLFHRWKTHGFLFFSWTS